MTNQVGRPPKITKEWAEEKAKTLPDLFREGESVAEVCVSLEISKDSFYKACEISEEFSDSYKRGLDYSEAWWSKLGRAGSAGSVDIQPTTWIFNMKNRFKWKDKHEVDNVSSDGSMTPQVIERVIIDVESDKAED